MASSGSLYVGKARSLSKRVASYFRSAAQLEPKTRVLMSQVASVEITATHTEGEALLLENSLIKEHQPRYNILLRDDKSFPYIHISTEQSFPRLAFHRGARNRAGRFFGPFASAGATRDTLNLLQKLFQVRQCEDTFYRNRSRPCLQYQIKRCTAPCVGLVDAERYQEDVRHVIMFLEGKSEEMIEEARRADGGGFGPPRVRAREPLPGPDRESAQSAGAPARHRRPGRCRRRRVLRSRRSRGGCS